MSKRSLALLLICSLFSGVLLSNAQISADDHNDPSIPLVLEEESPEKAEIEKSIDFDHDCIDQYSLNLNSIITVHHLVCENCFISLTRFSPDFSRAPPA